MSASQHRHTCDELGVCQNRYPRCANCAPFDPQDLIVFRAAAFCVLVLFAILILEKSA